MAWTTARTWVVGEIVTAALMNTHVRDNLNALKAPPSSRVLGNEGADYTTTSTSFADIDATDLALTITTTGGNILVVFIGSFAISAGGRIYLDIALDGTRQGGDDGLAAHYMATLVNTGVYTIPIVHLIPTPSAASHTIKVQWKVSGGTGTLHAGAGTSNFDLHNHMFIQEI